MDRLDNFKALKKHPWFSRVYSKLTDNDEEFCFNFLEKTSKLNNNDFAKIVVRLWLDKPKPKAWRHMEDLLIASI